MAEKSNSDVRNHNREREWLRSLGNGNIREGVERVVQESRKDQSSKKK